MKTHRRNPDKRYVLRLPFIRPPDIGDSKKIAQARFLQSERHLLTKPAAKAYSAFIGEMISLGHMERAHDAPDDQVYYMPQHAVAKQDGFGKIKVVSNASQATSNGRSLNNFLHTEPKLQADIVAILVQWRLFTFVFSPTSSKCFGSSSLTSRTETGFTSIGEKRRNRSSAPIECAQWCTAQLVLRTRLSASCTSWRQRLKIHRPEQPRYCGATCTWTMHWRGRIHCMRLSLHETSSSTLGSQQAWTWTSSQPTMLIYSKTCRLPPMQ